VLEAGAGQELIADAKGNVMSDEGMAVVESAVANAERIRDMVIELDQNSDLDVADLLVSANKSLDAIRAVREEAIRRQLRGASRA
jgi:hypothetical protein